MGPGGHTCFALRIVWITGNKYAAVFPDPVFALANISRPSKTNGIALLCTRVGVWKFCFAIPWSNRESKPSPANVVSSFTARTSAAGAGTSLASSLRFIAAEGWTVLKICTYSCILNVKNQLPDRDYFSCQKSPPPDEERSLLTTSCDSRPPTYHLGTVPSQVLPSTDNISSRSLDLVDVRRYRLTYFNILHKRGDRRSLH